MTKELLIQIEESRSPRADSLKNHDLLLRTAAQLFAERGVDAVTMSEIAQAAGVGKGTLYRHFQNKTDLCYELLDSDQRDLQNRTLERLRQQHDPAEVLYWFIEEVVGFVGRHLTLLCVIDKTRYTLESTPHRWWWQTIRGLLGRIHSAGDLDYLTDMVYVMLDPYSIRFQMITRGYDLPHIVTGMHQLLNRLVA